jgi:hypothetical protein
MPDAHKNDPAKADAPPGGKAGADKPAATTATPDAPAPENAGDKAPKPPAAEARPDSPKAGTPARERGETITPKGNPPIPTSKEVEAARKDHFGEGKPGAVHVDAQGDTGRTYLVFVDREGTEVARERYVPAKDKAKA